MSNIIAAVHANADLHQRLLTSLGTLDDASTTLAQADSNLATAKSKLAELDKRIKTLTDTTTKEQKEFEKIRNSASTKLKYTLMGKGQKYGAKVEKEEKEYHSALDELNAAGVERERLQADIQRATEAKNAVTDTASQHAGVRKQLDELYASVFTGPSPGFAEEDAAERIVHRTEEEYRNAQVHLTLQSQVTAVLSDASRCMISLLAELEKSRQAFGSMTYEFAAMETAKNALLSARTSSEQITNLVSLAKRTAIGGVGAAGKIPVEDVGEVETGEIKEMLTMKLLDKVRAAKMSAMVVKGKLEGELKKANQRMDLASGEMKEKIGELEKARERLFEARKAAWAVVLGMSPTEMPPDYI